MNIQIEFILFNLLYFNNSTKTTYTLSLPVGADDALDVLGAELVLVADFFKVLAGIDEEDIVWGSPAVS